MDVHDFGVTVIESADDLARIELLGGRSTTDGAGRFRIVDLEPGRYFFAVLEDAGLALGERPLYETGTFVRLVAERYSLRVHVRDESGRPVHGSRSFVTNGSARSEIQTGPDLEFPHGFAPGETWTVSAWLRGRAPAAVPVTFESGRYETEVTVAIPTAEPRARLRVRWVDPSGRIVPMFGVTLRDPSTGSALEGFEWDLFATDGARSVTAPEGTWSVELHEILERPEHPNLPPDPVLATFGTDGVVSLVLEGRPAASIRVTFRPLGTSTLAIDATVAVVSVDESESLRCRNFLYLDDDGRRASTRRPRLERPYYLDRPVAPGPRHLRAEVRVPGLEEPQTFETELELTAGGIHDVSIPVQLP
jgi:hypothetical protein